MLNNSLINLQLLSGGAQALITFVPTNAFDAVEVRLNSGIAGALNSINVNYAQRVVTTPSVDVPNPVVCETQTTTITVTSPKAGIIYKWYDATGTYQVGKDGTSFTTPAIAANTTFFVEATTASGCASARTAVNITVNPLPIQPILLSPNVLTCSGSDVILTIANPQPGYIYTWKQGAVVLQTGASSTYTITNVTTLGTYTVSATNSCGIASAETSTTVDVGTPTPPVITPSATTINNGERVLLTATSTSPGATFTWYSSDPALPGATVVSTPANGQNGTFLTPALTATTTYWVTSTATCVSAASSVIVTVNPVPGTGDVPCEAAIGQENAASGLLAGLAGVDNEDLVWDNNVNTGSSLRIPLGIGTSVYQRALFNGPSLIGDRVRVKLSSPAKLLSLALLQSVQITSYNGATSNGDTRTINDPLIYLELLSGDTEAIVEFTPTAIFDRVEVRINSGLLGALTSINFDYAQRIIVPPAVLAANTTACAGTSATLAIQNPVVGVTYKWYLGANYLSGQDGTTLTTDANLAAGTYDYFVSATRNGCESARTKVTVTVLAAPDAAVPVAGNPSSVCPNIPVSLGVTPVMGVTFNWYDVNGVLLSANTATYTTAANLAAGTYEYFVEALNGNSCASTAPRTKITLIVKPASNAADINIAGLPTSVCAGNAVTLTASSTTVDNATFIWYSDAALTNVVFTGPTFSPTVSATTTYYVTVSGDNRCANAVGDAKVVTLVVSPPATAADLNVFGADAAVCAGTTATLKAETTTVTSPVFNWYTDAALTNRVFTGAEFITPILTATTTYYVTVSGSNKCENQSASAEVVTLVVNPPANASDINIIGGSAPICSGTSTSLTATTTTIINPTFRWYSDAGLTNLVFTGATYNTLVLTGTATYYVTVSGANTCENTPATAKTVTITVNPPAIAADINVAGLNTSYCAGTAATLVASSTTVVNPVFTWYTDAALTNVAFIGTTFNTPPLTVTNTYYVTVQGTNKCENTPATARVVTLTVNPPATASDLTVTGNESALCGGGSARLLANSTTVTNPIFTWYSDAALTTPVFTGPVFNTPPLTATTTYFVTVKGDNRCENAAGGAKMVTVTVNTPAIPSDVIISGADAPYCAGNAVTLTASTATVNDPIFMWYTDAALTNAVFVGPVFTIPAASASLTYYVTVRGSNKCENVSGNPRVVNVVVNPLPEAPVVSSVGTNICSGDATVLTVQNAQAGIVYQWYDAATNGTLLFTGAQFNTSALNANTDFYVAASSASGCGNATGRVRVTVTVSPKPAVPTVLASTVNVCLGTPAVLSISNPVVGVTYRWYSAETGGILLGTGADFISPAVNSTTTFYVEASTASCVSNARTGVTVVPGTVPVAPASISGNSAPQCAGSGTVLTVNNPDPSVTYRWYTTQSGGTSVFEGNPFTVPALSATTTYYVESVNKASGCSSLLRTSVVVTILPKLDAPVVTVQLATANSITFQWAPVQGASGYEVSIDNGLSWINPSNGPTGTTYTVTGLQPDQNASIRVRALGQLPCQLSDATTLSAKADNPQGNNVFIPNTFTPNNDGRNDIFFIYGNTIAKMKLRVYNQWGQFLYESLSLQNGWDGTYRGQLQPNGVYVYYVDVEFNDGTKTTRKGTITLLR
ncbi:MAG: T9SS type B sorting domain-containing protein [Pedobacter sp.]|nr:MAG: T9SS type B sorting domain-containing protein [Pedobacter sp.]